MERPIYCSNFRSCNVSILLVSLLVGEMQTILITTKVNGAPFSKYLYRNEWWRTGNDNISESYKNGERGHKSKKENQTVRHFREK